MNQNQKEWLATFLEYLTIAGIEFFVHEIPTIPGKSLPKEGSEFETLGLVVGSQQVKGSITQIYIVPMRYKPKIYLSSGSWEWGRGKSPTGTTQ